MRLLHLDCETAPNICYTWGLFRQNIGISQIVEPGHTLCWAAKWEGEKGIMFDSIYESHPEDMLKNIWLLLDEADAVIHYNGKRFDIPVLNREFIKAGMKPPTPYHQIDLYQVVRSTFRFASNKLDWVCKELGIGAKVQHKGMSLWHDCMQLDPEAWKIMEKYNRGDVKLLPKLYHKLLPWIRVHPNHALYHESDRPVCPNCGSHHMVSRGYVTTATMKYQRYNCKDCGKWSRGRVNTLSTEEKTNILVGVT